MNRVKIYGKMKLCKARVMTQLENELKRNQESTVEVFLADFEEQLKSREKESEDKLPTDHKIKNNRKELIAKKA